MEAKGKAKEEAKGDTFQKLPRSVNNLLEAFGRCPLSLLLFSSFYSGFLSLVISIVTPSLGLKPLYSILYTALIIGESTLYFFDNS